MANPGGVSPWTFLGLLFQDLRFLLAYRRRPYILREMFRLKRAVQLYNEGELAAALECIKAGLANTPEPVMWEFWRLLQGWVQYQSGDFSAAHDTVEQSYENLTRVMPKKLYKPGMYMMYFRTRISLALMSRQYDRALQLRDEGAVELSKHAHPEVLFHYFFSDSAQTRRAIQESLVGKPAAGRLTRTWLLYLEGRLDLHDARTEAGLEKIARAAGQIPDHWIAREPERLARNEEALAAPGAGSRWCLANAPGL